MSGSAWPSRSAISFLLVIPIEPIVWLLALPSGLLIGYYANQRSNRAPVRGGGSSSTGCSPALVDRARLRLLLLLGVKALFFFADNGYRDAERWRGSFTCTAGADCVYQRYLLDRGGDGRADLAAAGVTDVDSFTSFYWAQQFPTAGSVVVLTTVGGLGGGAGRTGSRPTAAGGTRRPASRSPPHEPPTGSRAALRSAPASWRLRT